jgi:hypothetical protein
MTQNQTLPEMELWQLGLCSEYAEGKTKSSVTVKARYLRLARFLQIEQFHDTLDRELTFNHDLQINIFSVLLCPLTFPGYQCIAAFQKNVQRFAGQPAQSTFEPESASQLKILTL